MEDGDRDDAVYSLLFGGNHQQSEEPRGASEASSEASVLEGLAHTNLHYGGKPARNEIKHHSAMTSALHAGAANDDGNTSYPHARRTSLQSSVGSVGSFGSTGAFPQGRKGESPCCPCWPLTSGRPSSSAERASTAGGLAVAWDHSTHSDHQMHDENGYYEVLFGGAPGTGHDGSGAPAYFDPERRRVDKILETNPKRFPPLLPVSEGPPPLRLVCAFASVGGALLLWWLCPAAWLEHIPGAPAVVDDDNDDSSGSDDDGSGTGSGGGDLEDFRREVLAYASIPLVSCLFTYFHIWLALWMMFYPVTFTGCWRIPGTNVGLPFGWQGIVPFKAIKMIGIATDLILDRLIDLKAEFSKVKPEVVAALLEPSLHFELQHNLYPGIALKHKPALWNRLPDAVKQQVVDRGAEQAKTVVGLVLADMQAHFLELVDLKALVTKHFLSRPELLNEMFIQCGYQELLFIRNNGATLGFVFGLFQMVVWLLWHPNKEEPLKASVQGLVVFPLFGLAVGALTNWLSLLAIFKPVDPVDLGQLLRDKALAPSCLLPPDNAPAAGFFCCCGGCDNADGSNDGGDGNDDDDGDVENKTDSMDDGGSSTRRRKSEKHGESSRTTSSGSGGGCVLHGLFLRRQREVSAVYARLVGKEVLAMPTLVDAILTGSSVAGGQEVIRRLMRRHFENAFDDSLSAFDFTSLGVSAASVLGEAEVRAMREDTVQALLSLVPSLMRSEQVLTYFESALGLEVTLRERMVKLPNKDFEAILHPVFQEDEWKLIAVGGALGVAIGLLQAYFIN